MQMSRSDLADFAYFLAIAKHASFRQAASTMGVTTSALSHAITALEGRRGVRLLNRTTRSVTLTAAGEELRAMIEGPVSAFTPASVLQMHRRATVILDQAAASKLELREYYHTVHPDGAPALV